MKGAFQHEKRGFPKSISVSLKTRKILLFDQWFVIIIMGETIDCMNGSKLFQRKSIPFQAIMKKAPLKINSKEPCNDYGFGVALGAGVSVCSGLSVARTSAKIAIRVFTSASPVA